MDTYETNETNHIIISSKLTEKDIETILSVNEDFIPEDMFYTTARDLIMSYGFTKNVLQIIFGKEIKNINSLPDTPFYQLISVDGVASIPGKETPEDQRWNQENKDIIPSDVKIASIDDLEVRGLSHAMTLAAQRIFAYPRGLDNVEAEPAIRKYGEAFDKIMNTILLKQHQEYLQDENIPEEDVYRLFLLQGAQRLTDTYTGNQIVVEAKRINLAGEPEAGTKQDEAVPQEIVFGLGWFRFPGDSDENGTRFDEIKSKKDGITLVIPDDCGATLGSVMAAVFALLKKGVTIKEVHFVSSVVNQSGIELFLKNMSALGISAKVFAGDLVYKITNEGYLLRTKERIYEPDGSPRNDNFWDDVQAVYDMGQILTKYRQILAREAMDLRNTQN